MAQDAAVEALDVTPSGGERAPRTGVHPRGGERALDEVAHPLLIAGLGRGLGEPGETVGDTLQRRRPDQPTGVACAVTASASFPATCP